MDRNSQLDNYRKELNKLGLSTAADLKKVLKPLIKPATGIIVKDASNSPDDSLLRSHFGGQPYFEKGEEWPKSEKYKPVL